ncbi:MAG: nucleoside deaminase [archaeon]
MGKKDDERLMKLAIEKTKDGIAKGQTPFGACIVKNGRVISCVHNVVWKSTDITAHAEIHAIREACKKLKTIDLSGCIIYSTCEPCPMCFSACHWANISKVIYGAKISDAKKYGFNELTVSNREMKEKGKSKIRIIGDFLRDENVELFKLWAKNKDRKTY